MNEGNCIINSKIQYTCTQTGLVKMFSVFIQIYRNLLGHSKQNRFFFFLISTHVTLGGTYTFQVRNKTSDQATSEHVAKLEEEGLASSI